MRKKLLLTGMIAGILLLVSACGQGNSETPGNQTSAPSEPPVSASQPETSQPAESTQPEQTPASYIFSDMPIAAYEVTGLSVGLDGEVNQEDIYEPRIEDYIGAVPLVKLDPSRSFLLICTLRTEGDEYDPSIVKIHSPEGIGPWSATLYGCHDNSFPEIEGYSSGYPALSKESSYTYTETDKDGSFYSLNDPWTQFIDFAEIWHPGASDAIHVIEIKTYDDDDTFNNVDENTAALVETLKALGATDVQEVPVEEALTRCNIAVSSKGAN